MAEVSSNSNSQFAGRTSSGNTDQFESRFVAGETFTSRYKMTELLTDRGQLRYGLWEPPNIVIRGSEPVFTVTPELEHRPELVSKKFYGTTVYWWAIMDVNSILLPIRDMVAGISLVIPIVDEILSALARTRK